ncbi:MAG: hypothetical protein RL621_11 [Bacteroidota bacterium]|jgi:hypothetical protein
MVQYTYTQEKGNKPNQQKTKNMNTANNAPVAPVNPVNEPAVTAKRGRPMGWRSRFRIQYKDIKETAGKLGLNAIKVSIVQERKRTPEEIQAVISANLDKITDPVFMASVTVEKIDVGASVKQLAEKAGDEGFFEVGRADIINFYEGLKAQAIKAFEEADQGNE